MTKVLYVMPVLALLGMFSVAHATPHFESASFDVDRSVLGITFSKTIDISETDINKFGVARDTNFISFPLEGTLNSTAPDSDTVEIIIEEKQATAISSGRYLYIEAGAVKDTDGNSLVIQSFLDKPREEYFISVTSSVPPAVVLAEFEGNTLTVGFDKSVQNAEAESNMTVADKDKGSITISIHEINTGIMTIDFGVSNSTADTIRSMNNPVLTVDGGTFVDSHGTQNEDQMVPVAILDSEPPVVVSAGFEGNTLTVEFDKEVQHTGSQSRTNMLLSDGRNDLFVDIPDGHGMTLDVGVSDPDADTIRQMHNPVLYIRAGTFVDNHGAQNEQHAVSVTVEGADPGDTTPPTMVSATFYRGDNGLTVRFDEPVELSPGATVLFALDSDVFIHHTEQNNLSVNMDVVTLTVDQNVMDELGSHTLLTVAASVFEDLVGNLVNIHSVQYSIDDGTMAPVISLNGDDPLRHELGDPYEDPGATADDGSEVVTDATAVDVDQRGDYTVTYTATDGNGNKGMASRTVEIRDTTKPAISIIGDQNVTLELGDSYAEQGATVSDNDPDYATTQATVGGDAVDTGAVGVYTVTYTAPADDAGNEPDAVSRTVTVQDTTPPSFVSATFDFEAGILTVAFDQTIDVSELTATSVYVASQINGSAVVAHPVVDTASDSEVIVFQPESIDHGCDMSVGVGSSVKDLAGNSIEPSVFLLTLINAPESPPCRETPATRNAGFTTGGFKTTSVLASNAISYNVCDPSKDGAVRALTFNRPAIGEIGLNVYAVDSVSLGVDITGSVPASTYLSRVSPDYVYTVWEAAVPKGVGKFFVTVFDRDDGRVASAVLVDTTRGMECMGSIFPHELKDPRAEILPIGHVEQGS